MTVVSTGRCFRKLKSVCLCFGARDGGSLSVESADSGEVIMSVNKLYKIFGIKNRRIQMYLNNNIVFLYVLTNILKNPLGDGGCRSSQWHWGSYHVCKDPETLLSEKFLFKRKIDMNNLSYSAILSMLKEKEMKIKLVLGLLANNPENRS